VGGTLPFARLTRRRWCWHEEKGEGRKKHKNLRVIEKEGRMNAMGKQDNATIKGKVALLRATEGITQQSAETVSRGGT